MIRFKVYHCVVCWKCNILFSTITNLCEEAWVYEMWPLLFQTIETAKSLETVMVALRQFGIDMPQYISQESLESFTTKADNALIVFITNNGLDPMSTKIKAIKAFDEGCRSSM